MDGVVKFNVILGNILFSSADVYLICSWRLSVVNDFRIVEVLSVTIYIILDIEEDHITKQDESRF